MTFCIYTILFTLADKEPQYNKYVNIFQIWFSQLIKTRSVKNCVVIIDKKTLAYLKTKEIFNNLILPLRDFKLTLFEFNPPKTLIEGMSYKYSIFDYSEDFLIYTDLDVLIVNPLKSLNLPKEDKIYVHADSDERLIRRLRRDIAERGRDMDEVLSRYQTTLKPMHEQFIEPTKAFADIIIPNDKYNTVAIDVVRAVINQRIL